KDFAAFGWKPEDVPDPQARESFERSKLNWAELGSGHHAEMLAWHRQLIQLRQTEASLRDGRLELVQTRLDESARWFVVERGPVTVAVNLASETQPVSIRSGSNELLLASESGITLGEDGISLPP